MSLPPHEHIALIKAAAPGAPADFILRMHEIGADAITVKREWVKAQEERKQDQGRDARSRREQRRGGGSYFARPGVAPIASRRYHADETPDEDFFDGDAKSEFEAHVLDIQRAENCPRHEAHRRCCKLHPALRAAMVQQHNAEYGRYA